MHSSLFLLPLIASGALSDPEQPVLFRPLRGPAASHSVAPVVPPGGAQLDGLVGLDGMGQETVAGRLASRGGEPLVAALIRAERVPEGAEGGGRWPQRYREPAGVAVTDQEGRFVLRGLAAGRHRLLLEADRVGAGEFEPRQELLAACDAGAADLRLTVDELTAQRFELGRWTHGLPTWDGALRVELRDHGGALEHGGWRISVRRRVGSSAGAAGAPVEDAAPTVPVWGTTLRQGAYEVIAEPTGRSPLGTEAGGAPAFHLPARGVVNVLEGERSHLVLRTRPAGRIEIQTIEQVDLAENFLLVRDLIRRSRSGRRGLAAALDTPSTPHRIAVRATGVGGEPQRVLRFGSTARLSAGSWPHEFVLPGFPVLSEPLAPGRYSLEFEVGGAVIRPCTAVVEAGEVTRVLICLQPG